MNFKIPDNEAEIRIRITMSGIEQSIYSSPIGYLYRKSVRQRYWEHRILVGGMRGMHEGI